MHMVQVGHVLCSHHAPLVLHEACYGAQVVGVGFPDWLDCPTAQSFKPPARDTHIIEGSNDYPLYELQSLAA